jgi:hypothetical protein
MKFKSKIITEYLDSNKYDFYIFNIDYTINELETINDFKIKNPNNYEHFGSLDDIKDLKKYLTNIGNNTKTCVNGMEKLIIRLIKKVLLGYKMKYFWLAIRISPPNKNFDIPRWHKDGTFFIGDKNEQSSVKFITTLKGPGTLLIKSTKKINKIYNEILEEQFTEMSKYKTIQEKIKIGDNFRPIFAKKFVKEKYIQAKNNDGILFYTGFPHNNAALHSEPKMTTSRIFISILPSSYENIKDLQKRWVK